MTTIVSSIIRPFLLIIAVGLVSFNLGYCAVNPITIAPLHGEYDFAVESLNAKTISEAAVAKCLLNTSGKVYSIQQGKKTSAFSNTTKVEVRVEKTDGKAKTEVKICLWTPGVHLGTTTVKKTYVFEKGNYKRTKTFKVFKAKDKKIIVYIDNKSVTNTFSYKLRVDEI